MSARLSTFRRLMVLGFNLMLILLQLVYDMSHLFSKRRIVGKSQKMVNIVILITHLINTFGAYGNEFLVNSGCQCITFSSTFGKDYGSFKSPDYPKPYSNNVECILYTFVGSSDEIVEITFKDFNLYRTQYSCLEGDHLKIFAHLSSEHINEHTKWDNAFCGRFIDLPRPVHYSSSNVLVLAFHNSRSKHNATGFYGTFRFLDKDEFSPKGGKLMPNTMCDWYFNSDSILTTEGTLFSPTYPATYPPNIRCTYVFNAKSDETITVIFDEVILRKGDDSCLNANEVLNVYDGRSSSSDNMLSLCNEVFQVQVTSSYWSMRIELVVNGESPEGRGFKATYRITRRSDDSILNKEIYVINRKMKELLTSFNSESSSWNKYFSRISMDFKNTLEGGDKKHKYFKFGPGANNDKFSKGIFTTGVSSRSCDKIFESSESSYGDLSFPRHFKSYANSEKCVFLLKGHGKERVQLKFTHVFLPPLDDDTPCSEEGSIIVYENINGRMEKIKTICNDSEIMYPIMSSSSTLFVQFFNAHSANVLFKGNYNFVKDFGVNTNGSYQSHVVAPCIFEYDGTKYTEGRFTGPNHPGNYPKNTECHYIFRCNDIQRITINFLYFETEGVAPCDEHTESDYVEIAMQETTSSEQRFRRYCGILKPFNVTSSGNFLRVTFKSNSVLDGRNFEASYSIREPRSQREETVPTKEKEPEISLEKNAVAIKSDDIFFYVTMFHIFRILLFENG